MVNLHFECNGCQKSVFNDGVFLTNNGDRWGFCDLKCAYTWLGKSLETDAMKTKKGFSRFKQRTNKEK